VCQNYISPENLNTPLEVTEVIQASFDSNGEWLATIEYWNDGVMTPEMRLKFWQFNTEKQRFVGFDIESCNHNSALYMYFIENKTEIKLELL
jgi:NET1-associated nuclear protein 1 (U3 small nucleolar RNA-associated protein 17)